MPAPELLEDPDTLEHRDLTVVMPVYNEEASLGPCAQSWLRVLDGLGIDYCLLIINDGSKDSTGETIETLGEHERVRGISKSNAGHGPTILQGYRLAVRTSEWVFQVDSDDEIPASAFASLWSEREDNDMVFGIRTGRDQTTDRVIITRVAALTTRLLLGGRARDSNVPFRLMRSTALAPVLEKLPADTFAPNVIISGVLSRDPSTFTEVEVPHQMRQAGEVSIIGIGAAKAAARSFVQTVRLAWSFRGRVDT